MAEDGSGLEYLLSRRGRDGLWRDFLTPAGASSQWVSGYVGHALLNAGHPGTDLATTARSLLREQKADGGWGYNDEVPTDADSTAYVVQFLAAAHERHLSSSGPESRPLTAAARCLARHQDGASGGVATYAEPGPIRTYMGLGPDVSIAGWTRPHLCVTAAAGRAFAAVGETWTGRAIAAWKFIAASQAPDGLWHSYWWRMPEYPTCCAVLLGRDLSGVEDVAAPIERACSAVASRQNGDGGWPLDEGDESIPFATALSLRILCESRRYDRQKEAAAEWLHAHRRPDGSWESHPSMRIPPPSVVEPRDVARWRLDELGTGVIIADRDRLYVTATCVDALVNYERCEMPS